MTELAAQVSLYPLGQEDLSPTIDEVLSVFEAHGLRADVGADEHGSCWSRRDTVQGPPRGSHVRCQHRQDGDGHHGFERVLSGR